MCSHMYVYMDILLSVSIYLPGGTGHEYFSVIAQCIIIWDRYIPDGVYSALAGLGVVCSVFVLRAPLVNPSRASSLRVRRARLPPAPSIRGVWVRVCEAVKADGEARAERGQKSRRVESSPLSPCPDLETRDGSTARSRRRATGTELRLRDRSTIHDPRGGRGSRARGCWRVIIRPLGVAGYRARTIRYDYKSKITITPPRPPSPFFVHQRGINAPRALSAKCFYALRPFHARGHPPKRQCIDGVHVTVHMC
ncbi:hypothetical protein KQX54_011040 [Cotesia glomerata]|uniref:Uncharacterized protein n=1 Tax=Cotesia glomerata TaxID=32391 RepID=A0AAV7J9C4_COTGL|nr:hypothetical protein KQX54_011040 [Cotesia glomerata]